MARQLQDTEPMQNITVRMPVGMIAHIDAYRDRLKAHNPAFRVERGEAVRDLLLKALDLVTPREDHIEDREDHSHQMAAQSKDQQRTTGQTGRKRPTAAKG